MKPFFISMLPTPRYLAARERKGGGGDDSMELILEMSQQVSIREKEEKEEKLTVFLSHTMHF